MLIIKIYVIYLINQIRLCLKSTIISIIFGNIYTPDHLRDTLYYIYNLHSFVYG